MWCAFSLYCDGLCQDGLYGIPKTYKARALVIYIHRLCQVAGGGFYLALLWTGDRCPLLAHNNLSGRGERGDAWIPAYPAKKITGK